MTNEEFFYAYRGEPILYKGKDIDAYVAGFVEEKYIILGFFDYKGCILTFNINVIVDEVFKSNKALEIRKKDNGNIRTTFLYS